MKGPFKNPFKDFTYNRSETHGAVVGNIWSSPRLSVSNLCDLIQLLQLFPACFMHTPFVTLSMFVALSNFRRLINLLSFSHPFLFIHFFTLSTHPIYAPYKCTCCTHHKHKSLPCLIVRTLSAPIYLYKSPGVIGQRAILTMGGSDRGWGFSRRTICYPIRPLSRHFYVWGI